MKKVAALMMSFILAASAINVNAYAKGENSDTVIYVSPTGSDYNEGTFEKPLKSLAGAKRVASAKKSSFPTEEITVCFMGGEYYVDSQVYFELKDSGNEYGDIVYKAYNDEEVTFTASKTVSGSKFKKVTDKKMQERIPENARERMMYIDFADAGVGSIEPFKAWVGGQMCRPTYPLLFVDGDKQELSRWPNEGYAYTGKMIVGGSEAAGGFNGGIGYDFINEGKPFTFKYTDTEPDKWKDAKNFMLEGYFTYEYFCGAYNVASIDTDIKTITSVQGSNGGAAKENRRWYARNLIEEADLPGEYYIDYNEKKLYLNPPYSLKDSEIEVVFNDNQLVSMNDAKYITFEGINFEKTRSSAFQLYKCDNIKFIDCKFNEIGKRGLEVYYNTNLLVDGCEFNSVGGSAIYISGGDFVTLTPSGNKIVNSSFYKWGEYQKSYEPGIQVTDVGILIQNNNFHHAPFSACLMAGNDNQFLNNEIYNVLYGLNDGGAFYLGMNATRRGNEVAYNYVHDLYEGLYGEASLIAGLYFDDGSSGNYIHHNIVTHAKHGIITTGRDNVVHHNIVSATKGCVGSDNRGEGWQYGQYFNADGSYATNSRFFNQLKSVPYTSEPYQKYPHLSNMFDEDIVPINIPAYNSIYDNLSIGKNAISDSAAKYATRLENNAEVENTDDFVDFEGRNFKIKEDSTLYATHSVLNEINIDEMGTKKAFEVNDIQLLYPMNKEKDVNANEVVFQWTAVNQADKYVLKIATDKNMKNIVKTVETEKTFAIINTLSDARTRYYWTVDVKNLSNQNGFEKKYEREPNTFVTSYYSAIDKSELKALRNNIMDIASKMTEGDGLGEYSKEIIDKASSIITELSKGINNPAATEYEVKALAENIQNKITEIEMSANPGYRNISELMEDGLWTGISHTSDAYAVRGTASYDNKLTPNEAVCMRVKAEDISSKPLSIGIRSSAKQIVTDTKTYKGYVIEISKDEIRVLKYRDGGTETISAVPNTFINDSEYHEVRIGAFRIATGIKIMLYIDNQRVFGYKDRTDPITESGFLVFNGAVQLSASNDVPTEKLNPNADDNPKPYYLDMKELLSSSDNWESNGTFTLTDGVLSASGGTQIWTKAIIPQNAIIRFMGKFTPGTSWQGVAVKDSNPSSMPWEKANDYLVCLKPESIEIQTFNKGKNIYYCIQDADIDWNEWHEYEIASYDTEKGCKVVLKIDGKDYLTFDDETPISTAGHLAIFDFSKLGYEIKACE